MNPEFALGLTATALLPALYGMCLPPVATTHDSADTVGLYRAHVVAGAAGLALALGISVLSPAAGWLVAGENLLLFLVYWYARGV